MCVFWTKCLSIPMLHCDLWLVRYSRQNITKNRKKLITSQSQIPLHFLSAFHTSSLSKPLPSLSSFPSLSHSPAVLQKQKVCKLNKEFNIYSNHLLIHIVLLHRWQRKVPLLFEAVYGFVCGTIFGPYIPTPKFYPVCIYTLFVHSNMRLSMIRQVLDFTQLHQRVPHSMWSWISRRADGFFVLFSLPDESSRVRSGYLSVHLDWQLSQGGYPWP